MTVLTLQHDIQPHQLRLQVAFDIRDPHVHDLVVAGFQPGLSGGAVGDDRLGLAGVLQFDRQSVHEGDEIRDVAADRGLALEPAG
jgi:hypothetical protein